MSDKTATAADRVRATLVLVATIATIAYNALAAVGLINGVTPSTISDRHPSAITPAGYAFSIWSLIYLWMIAFSIYQLLPANVTRFRRVRTLYLASCVLNCAWIWFWHHGQIAICLALIIGLAVVLFFITHRFANAGSLTEALFTKAPFGIYFGWVTCASLVNLNILVSSLGAGASLLLGLGIGSILFAAVASFLVRWKLANYLYPLAAAWAIGAIAVKQSSSTPIVIAAAFATVACLVIAGSVVTNLKDSTSEQG